MPIYRSLELFSNRTVKSSHLLRTLVASVGVLFITKSMTFTVSYLLTIDFTMYDDDWAGEMTVSISFDIRTTSVSVLCTLPLSDN
jgi:hypothetical protein